VGGGAEDATSLRTSVLANRMEFNWLQSRTWSVMVERDQSWAATARIR
jgi:hypothetical protein